MDYADQRYYASTFGRFMTPDPYQASGGPSNPGSWNRYSYVQDDPVNYQDPQGLFIIAPPPTIIIPVIDWTAWSNQNFSAFLAQSALIRRLMLAWAFEQDPDQVPPKNKNGDRRDLDSVDCDQAVIDAMKSAWAQSANGTTGVEATFLLVGDANNYTIVQVPFTNQQMAQTLDLPSGTFALYHVHPNKGDAKPSDHDKELADHYHISINTLTSQGLYGYDPDAKTTEQLTRGLDWTKPCPRPK